MLFIHCLFDWNIGVFSKPWLVLLGQSNNAGSIYVIMDGSVFQEEWSFEILQSFTKYLGLGTIYSEFNFCFSRVFCKCGQNFHFGRETGH